MVLCLRESGAEEPTFYRDAERRPITPVTADQQDTEPAEPADDNRSPGSGQ